MPKALSFSRCRFRCRQAAAPKAERRSVLFVVRRAPGFDDDRMKACFYPEPEKDQLFPQGYIAEHPGHSRGGTVDLTLFDMTA